MNLSHRRQLLAAFLLGAIAALGQAPFDLPIVMFGALICAVWLLSQTDGWRRAAWIGWLFGAGYFALALHWIVQPFLVDVARHGWMAPFALVLMAGGLALFWGLAFGMARWLSSGWAIAFCLPAIEMLRAYIFTGFPWAMFVQGLVDSLAGQGLAWGGPYGLSIALVGAAACVIWLRPIWRWVPAIAMAAVILLPAPEEAAPKDQTVRLIQPNAPQHEKWDPEKIPLFFASQLQFTAAGDPPDLVVWPETAIPWSLERAGPALDQIASAARGAPVLLGVQRFEDGRYFNALASLDAQGALAGVYDKHHLVPFGEYFPMGDTLGIFGLAETVGGGYSSGPGARLIEVAGIGPVLPLICYEAVFAHDVNAAPARPALIVQVTNDAWFGPAAGPYQHLAQARMRAIEQGVPVARSANTGVSAMIGPRGAVLAHLPMGQAGFVDAGLPAVLAPTLYSKTKDWPLAIFFVLSLGWITWRRGLGNTD